jgi:hypothetical protein
VVATTRNFEGAVEQDLAAAEDRQPVAGFLDVGDDVGRQQRGRSVRAHRFEQDVDELAAGERVQVRQRLVQEQQPGPGPQSDGQPELGGLAAREGVGPLV